MNNIYKINKESIWKYFWKSIITTFLFFFSAFFIFLYYKDKLSYESLSIIFCCYSVFSWFVIFGFPTTYLFFNHLKNNKDVSLEIDGQLTKYLNKKKIINFYIKDIKKIELWLTPPKYYNRTDWQYFGEYHFSRFYLFNGEILDVSCLVFDQTEAFFSKELIDKKKKFFPIPSSPAD